MALSLSAALPAAKPKPGKLVLGFMAAAITALVGLSGVAGATSDKPDKPWCDTHGFKDKPYGQCVKEWAKQQGHGHGYGGNHHININTDLEVNVRGNNNVVNVIINYIIG